MALYSSDQSRTEINYSERFPYLNLLSIDFDWIMKPSIQEYNDYVSEDLTNLWTSENLQPYLKAQYSRKNYADLWTLCNNIYLNSSDQLITMNYHKMIYDDLHIHHLNQPFVIYNIDHHHDLGYSDNNNFTQDNQINLNSGNWVNKIYSEYGDQFEQYIWIKNENSDHVSLIDGLSYPEWEETETLLPFQTIKWDKVYLCSSFAWIPPYIRPLFHDLVTLIEKNIKK